MPRKVSTEQPAHTANAAARGQMLRHLISLTGKSVPAFAQEAGLNRGTMNALLNGQNDPEVARPQTARRIVLALGMAEREIADALGLSPVARTRWRVDQPTSPDPDPALRSSGLHAYRLGHHMMGEVVLPANAEILVDPSVTDVGVQVIKLSSGQWFSMRAGAGAQAAGQVLGRLVSATFPASPESR